MTVFGPSTQYLMRKISPLVLQIMYTVIHNNNVMYTLFMFFIPCLYYVCLINIYYIAVHDRILYLDIFVFVVLIAHYK